MDLSKYISLKIFWICVGTGTYQPLFEFTETGQRQRDIIDACFIYAKRIRVEILFNTVATKLKKSLSASNSSGRALDTHSPKTMSSIQNLHSPI